MNTKRVQRPRKGAQAAPAPAVDKAPSDAALGIGAGIGDDAFEGQSLANAPIDRPRVTRAESETPIGRVHPGREQPDQSPPPTPDPAPAFVEPPEPTLTRRSRTASGDNNFDVPKEFQKPGWDYEWKTIRVVGADVDGYELASYHEQGWRAVKGSDMPKMLSPGSGAETIDRLGQRLMMRPMHLTEEARREDYVIAETQKLDKLKAASAIPIAGSASGKMHGTVDHFEIEGVVGTTKAKAA